MKKEGKIVKLNSKPESFTIEKTRELKGFEKLTDDEAKEIIESLKKFSLILLKAYRASKTNFNRQAA